MHCGWQIIFWQTTSFARYHQIASTAGRECRNARRSSILHKGSDEKRTTTVSAARDEVKIESGIEDLIVLKTTKSGFVGFIKDCYTTLPESTDRIFCTSVKADWRYANAEAATGENWRNVRQTISKPSRARSYRSHTLTHGRAFWKNSRTWRKYVFAAIFFCR